MFSVHILAASPRGILGTMTKVLYEGQGEHNHCKVVDQYYDGRPARLLLSGKDAPQSGMALDDDPELLFDYNQRFFEVALSLSPKSILVIGGGAFTLPSALADRFPASKVDAVEIDPILHRLAHEYFRLSDGSNLTIISQDGREYIDDCQKSYDLIIVDAFSEFDIPESIINADATASYARLLRPNGTLALNLISTYYSAKPTLAHKLLDTFRLHFVSTELYPTDPHYPRREEQNYLLIASHQQPPNLDYLQSAEVKRQTFLN